MKKWYLSKTLWTNAMVMVAALLAGMGVVEIPLADQGAVVAGVLAVVNVVLRALTSTGIEA